MSRPRQTVKVHKQRSLTYLQRLIRSVSEHTRLRYLDGDERIQCHRTCSWKSDRVLSEFPGALNVVSCWCVSVLNEEPSSPRSKKFPCCSGPTVRARSLLDLRSRGRRSARIHDDRLARTRFFLARIRSSSSGDAERRSMSEITRNVNQKPDGVRRSVPITRGGPLLGVSRCGGLPRP